MKVKILYFAQLREAKGKAEETLEIDAGASAGDLLRTVLEGLGKEAAVAVNREIVSLNTPLHEGDEVAFLPPLSGG